MTGSYPWYSHDWRTSEAVLAMTAEQRDVYRNLIDVCWDEGSLPTNEKLLRKLSLAEPDEWERSWPVVKVQFEERDGRLWNRKVDEKRPAVIKAKADRRKGGDTRAKSVERVAGRFVPSGQRQLNDQLTTSSTPAEAPAATPAEGQLPAGSSPPDQLQPSSVFRIPSSVFRNPSPETAEDAVSSPPAAPPKRHSKVSRISEQTAPVPSELTSCLEDLHPDSGAVRQLWEACRARDPNCTPKEVSYVCWLKNKALTSARNPIGLLIASVPEYFTDGGGEVIQEFRRKEAS